MPSAWKSPSNSVCFRPPFGLAKFSFSSFRLGSVPVAQPDRASDFGSEGWGFESLQARHSKRPIMAPRLRICMAILDTLFEYPPIVTGRRSEADLSIFSDVALRDCISAAFECNRLHAPINAAKAIRSRQTGVRGNSLAPAPRTAIDLAGKQRKMMPGSRIVILLPCSSTDGPQSHQMRPCGRRAVPVNPRCRG